ncbi:hypothetical protein [Nitrosomonas sp. Is37]|uniref:hypothetical protein n=1 Tax=Nitrosomonas sp. Is37 TaxID=3080535 RepID=UPI00294B7F67|nr:hypothetical protein [Nitrosomonas sp. Is37]MDV6344116.1 hypothetical protein [Nitrosomonas sp. Is37]
MILMDNHPVVRASYQMRLPHENSRYSKFIAEGNSFIQIAEMQYFLSALKLASFITVVGEKTKIAVHSIQLTPLLSVAN